MNMEFYRKLPTPKELKEEFPASDKIQKIKAETPRSALSSKEKTISCCLSSDHAPLTEKMPY